MAASTATKREGCGAKFNFVGEAASGVTGSCIWVQMDDYDFLIECGLYQGSGDPLEEYNINNKHFDFKPGRIKYIFAAHCHGDHILRIPLVFKRGGTPDVIMPEGSKPIAEILTKDSVNIMRHDAALLSRRFGRRYEPIYDIDDAEAALAHIQEYPIGDDIHWLDDNLGFRFIPSGHILNSAQIEFTIRQHGITKTVAYTSDLGNIHLSPVYTNTFEPITKTHLFIGESTYGGEKRIATKRARADDMEKLRNTVTSTIENGGRVLIPVFANSRAQIILTALYDLFGDDKTFKTPIVFDTPMGSDICEAYKALLDGEEKAKWEKVLGWRNIVFVRDPWDSIAWQNDKRPSVIISSSGMLTHGRSRQYAKVIIGDPNSVIVFCGFSVSGSLASIIKSGKSKSIKFSGKFIPNRCQSIDLRSFSSHMQRDNLIDYYSSVNCEKILLVHGEKESKQALSMDLKKAISKNDLTSKVVCVQQGYSITV